MVYPLYYIFTEELNLFAEEKRLQIRLIITRIDILLETESRMTFRRKRMESGKSLRKGISLFDKCKENHTNIKNIVII